MLTALLIACLVQGQPVPPAPTEEPPPRPRLETGAPIETPPRPQKLNGVEFVVNEEAVTLRDFVIDLQRNNRPNATERERQAALEQTFSQRVRNLLMEQAGRDVGFDAQLVQRFIENRTREGIEDAGGVVDFREELRNSLRLSPTEWREILERSTYRDLWMRTIDGRDASVSGRTAVDRYVRPGRLLFESERASRDELAPLSFDFQSVLIGVEPAGGAAAAKAMADEIVALARGGADFTTLVRERSHSTTRSSDGWELDVPIAAVESRTPELAEFLRGAAPGAVSDPIPMRLDGELIAFRVTSGVVRHEETFDFATAATQDALRTRIQEGMARYRRDRAVATLLDAAYVWPQELFRPGE